MTRAVHILKQLCASLAEAHARGLLHRDIKPPNVFLTERGGQFDFVKVLDFGLVKDIAEDADRTHELAGTLPTSLRSASVTPNAWIRAPISIRSVSSHTTC